MKTSLFLVLAMLVGCSHSPGPKSPDGYTITETSRECSGGSCKVVTRQLPDNGGPPVREVTVKPISDLPKTQGQVVEVEVVPDPFEQAEQAKRDQALMKAMEDAVKHDANKCMCAWGD